MAGRQSREQGFSPRQADTVAVGMAVILTARRGTAQTGRPRTYLFANCQKSKSFGVAGIRMLSHESNGTAFVSNAGKKIKAGEYHTDR
jgi:hypothetical protein